MAEKQDTDEDAVPGRNTSSHLCQPCAKKNKIRNAEVFCGTCEELQCQDCTEIHNVYSFMKDHNVQQVQSLNDQSNDYDMQGLDECKMHGGEVITSFCETDNELCCNKCLQRDHSDCEKVSDIKSIAGKDKDFGKKLESELKLRLSRAKFMVQHVKMSKEHTCVQTNNIPVALREMREKFDEHFEKFSLSVANNVENFLKNRVGELDKNQVRCEKYVVSMTNSLATLKEVHATGTPVQQFIAQQKLKKVISSIEGEFKIKASDFESVSFTADFDSTLKTLIDTLSILTQLTLKFSVSDEVMHTIHDEGRVKLQLISSVDCKQLEKDTSEPFYTGIDFLPNGRLVLVDNKNKYCLLFNEKLEKVASHVLPFTPIDVVAVSNATVVVTCGGAKRLLILHISETNEISTESTVIVSSKFETISLGQDNTFVAGTNDDFVPVRVVSITGKETDLAIKFPQKLYALDTSACAYIRKSDKIVFSDTRENTIFIYDASTNTRIVLQDEKIGEPRGLAIGPYGTVFICSFQNGSIVHISQTGRILLSHKLNIHHPRCICVHENRKFLAVTNSTNGNMKIQLFKMIEQ